MKLKTLSLVLVLIAATAGSNAQSSTSSTNPGTAPSAADADNAVTPVTHVPQPVAPSPRPFSRIAVGGGISLMGINLQTAVEANRYLNIRGVGNVFSYSVNNITVSGGNGSSGVNASGKLSFASAGIAADYYPWPNHGFRLSPGVMLFNDNGISATGTATSGTSITLGSQKYYADFVNPFQLNANLGLNTHKQAFTMTTGWGNMLSRQGGHWSFPFELGAVFTGVPTISLNLTGNGCTNQIDAATNGPSCVNMATNTTAQSNIASQIAKYQKDLNPLKVYPILSFGVGYNFSIH